MATTITINKALENLSRIINIKITRIKKMCDTRWIPNGSVMGGVYCVYMHVALKSGDIFHLKCYEWIEDGIDIIDSPEYIPTETELKRLRREWMEIDLYSYMEYPVADLIHHIIDNWKQCTPIIRRNAS